MDINYDFELDGIQGTVPCTASLRVDVTKYPRETFSFGGYEVTCSLVCVHVGGLALTRAQALEMFGIEGIAALEFEASQSDDALSMVEAA